MSFNPNFDDDDDLPFDINELSKIFQQLQQSLFKQLREQGIDPSQLDIANIDIKNISDMSDISMSDIQDMMKNNPNMKRFGFSLHMGPDGKPHVQPLDSQNMPFKQDTPSKNGFEEPFIDVFHDETTKQFQIIAEVRGVTDPDHIHLKVDENDLLIHAETGPFKYRKSMLLKHPIDQSTLSYTLTNGVLEIRAKSQ